METKKIFILTQSFPYGDKETPFIYNELKRISENFSEVVILPFSTKGKNDLPLPPNVTIEKVFEDYNYKISIKTVGYCFLKLPIALPDLISNLGVLLKKGNLKNYLSLYLQTADKFIHFKKKADLLINENSLVYSFWFNEWVTLFAIYRNRNINLISRAHGFDLYENRHTFTFIPFRKYSIKHLNKLVAISENGFLYLNERYYQMKNKFHLSYLGSKNHNLAQPAKKTAVLSIISCSNLVSLKRVHLIAEAIAKLKIPVKWVHIGAGPELKPITDKCNTLGIGDKVILKGHMSNEEIISFYAQNYFDVFINVSETEGLPVSLMEAASFGIPMIATNVGGNSEIVTNETGILIDKDFTTQQLAEILNSFCKSPCVSSDFRSGVRTFWEKKFNSNKNSDRFISQILLSTN